MLSTSGTAPVFVAAWWEGVVAKGVELESETKSEGGEVFLLFDGGSSSAICVEVGVGLFVFPVAAGSECP